MPELTLDAEHRYWLDGKYLDGLTSTISEAGLIRTNGDPWYANRGTAVHLATELDDKGILDESTVDPEIMGFLESWRRFRRDQNYMPKIIEHKLFHPELLVGMTVDRLPGPYDLKSGSPEPWHILQVSVHWATLKAQGMAEMIMTPADIYLDPDGGSPKVKVYTQAQMREAFKVYASLLVFIRWCRERGVKHGSTNC